MIQMSKTDVAQTKAFCENHTEQTIMLVSSVNGKSTTFEARLSLAEFKAVCDFVTDNLESKKPNPL